LRPNLKGMAQVKDKKALIEKLFNEDDELVIETIAEIKDKGDELFIAPLLDLLLAKPAYSVTLAIIDLLANMKHKGAIREFGNLFWQPKYHPIAHHTLSILWNSTFSDKANPHISRIVEMGLTGDYSTLLEAVTLVENLVAPFDEAQLLDGISQCKTFIAANKNDERLPLIKQLADILSYHDNHNSDVAINEA